MLWERDECRDLWDEIGVEKERPLISRLLSAPDSGYGLFLVTLAWRYLCVKGMFFCFWARPESAWEDFRFARRFIQVEKGRRRAWRSFDRKGPSVEAMSLDTNSETFTWS